MSDTLNANVAKVIEGTFDVNAEEEDNEVVFYVIMSIIDPTMPANFNGSFELTLMQ